MPFREPVIIKFKSVYLDRETHRKLRMMKKPLGKSMMQIIKDLVMQEYERLTQSKQKWKQLLINMLGCNYDHAATAVSMLLLTNKCQVQCKTTS